MVLRAGYLAIAQKLQEAADLSAGDLRSRLADAINDCFRGTGQWAYYIDHFGDSESGDVIYSVNSDTRRAPYSITATGSGAATCVIDTEASVDVVPRTIYEEEADEPAHYAAMAESLKVQKLYNDLPLYERFISKAERDKASADDFAGKGKSFPILKPEDVTAAAQSIGRAGSGNLGPSGIKARIIAIAKRKGWEKYLPKAWKEANRDLGGDVAARDAFCKAKSLQEALNSLHDVPETASIRSSCKALFESSLDVSTRQESLGLLFSRYMEDSTDQRRGHDASTQLGRNGNRESDAVRQLDTRERDRATVGRETPQKHSTLTLVESAETLDPIILREARADYEVKLIAPGKGSSAFYPAEVLKRDGPGVFKEGTHVYLNHPTASEEAQRPEGDVKNLAGVLTTTAVYHEAHAKGPGLYARMKVFADHAQIVEEKAAHVGMSIRASGIAESGKLRDGVPVLKQLTGAESVDVVTKAGAGGMILTEAAKPANPTEEAAMDAAQLTALQESIKAANATNAKLLERALRGDAREEATRLLRTVTLPDLGKERVIEASLRVIPKTEAGELDRVKFGEVVTAEAKREGAYVAQLTNAGQVRGMGATVVTPTPEQAAQHKEAAVKTRKEAINIFEALGLPKQAATAAASQYGEGEAA